MTNHFEKNVDRRSRQSMIDFLAGHFRYDTMSSWNGCTSWANKIKLHNLGLTSEQLDQAYEVIQTDYWHHLDSHIHDFRLETNYQHSIGVNGRSGGYLVLYEAERKPSGYKSHCTACGQQNFKRVEESSNVCGHCRLPHRVNDMWENMVVNTFPGRSIGDVDFTDAEEWDMDSLKSHVDLVCAFDRICDDIRASFIDLLVSCVVRHETVMVPQERVVLACAGGGNDAI